jgi:hypothetical protein
VAGSLVLTDTLNSTFTRLFKQIDGGPLLLTAYCVVWAVFFCFSLAIGRIVSLAIDGRASPLLDVYLGLEIIGGLLGVVVLAYARD